MEEQVTPASFEQVVEGELNTLQITDTQVDIVTDDDVSVLTYKQRHELELEEAAKEVEALPVPTDPKTRQANQDVLTKLVRWRRRLDEKRKEIFKPIKTLQEDVYAYIGTTPDAGLQGRISAMESAVKANIEAFDKAEERKRQEELERQEAENTRRRKLLIAEGMNFDGDGFTFGPFRAEAKDVYAATGEKFDKVLTTVRAAVQAKKENDEAAAEAQRKEAERLKAEADKQAEERRKFEEERAEFNRQKEEREAKERGDRWFNIRSTELRMMGAVALPDAEGQLVFTLGQVSAAEETLRTADEGKWAAWMAEFEGAFDAKMSSPVLASAPVEAVPFTEERFVEAPVAEPEPSTLYEGAQLTEEDVAVMDEAIRNPPTERGMVERLRHFLVEIEGGEGRFSMDPLEHASNTIEDMKALATAGIEEANAFLGL